MSDHNTTHLCRLGKDHGWFFFHLSYQLHVLQNEFKLKNLINLPSSLYNTAAVASVACPHKFTSFVGVNHRIWKQFPTKGTKMVMIIKRYASVHIFFLLYVCQYELDT